jgi:hypothetical protein
MLFYEEVRVPFPNVNEGICEGYYGTSGKGGGDIL